MAGRVCRSFCGIIALIVGGILIYGLLPAPNQDLLDAIKVDDVIKVQQMVPIKIRDMTRESFKAGVYQRATINDIHFGSGMRCMHTAAMRSALGVMQWLLIQEGIEIDITKDNDNRTPLHMAATYSNVTMVQLLLDHGADIHAKGVNDWTPLLLAVLFSNTDTVELLLSRGGSAMDRVLDGQSAIMLAMNYAPPKVQRMLIAHGATLEPNDYYYDEYLHACADIEKHNDWVVITPAARSSASSSVKSGRTITARTLHDDSSESDDTNDNSIISSSSTGGSGDGNGMYHERRRHQSHVHQPHAHDDDL